MKILYYNSGVDLVTETWKQITVVLLSYHVNLAIILHDTGTKQEGKHKLMFLKQASTYIAIQTEGEVFIDVHNTLCHIVWKANTHKNNT